MKPVEVEGYTNGQGNASQITIKNLRPEELEMLQGMLKGMHWVAIDNGRITISPRFEPLPSPIVDEKMMPFWRRHEFPDDGKLQVSIFDPERFKNNYGASIQIQSLCGYNYSKENYQHEAKKLISWGFDCLRSKREEDGRFREIWYLPGIWAAKGTLAETLAEKKQKMKEYTPQERLQDVVSFLCVNSQFGSLDVTVQRAAMVNDD